MERSKFNFKYSPNIQSNMQTAITLLVISSLFIGGLTVSDAFAWSYDDDRNAKVAAALESSSEASSILSEYNSYKERYTPVPVLEELILVDTPKIIDEAVVEVVTEPTVEPIVVELEESIKLVDEVIEFEDDLIEQELVDEITEVVDEPEPEPVYVKKVIYEKQGLVEGSPFANPDYMVKKVIMVLMEEA
jgi:hypothetical protein